MACADIAKQISLDRILFLTDFSDSSEAALQFTTAVAQKYGSTVYAAHVLLPDAYIWMAPEFGDLVNRGLEQAVNAKMRRVDLQLRGLRHHTLFLQGSDVWSALQPVMRDSDIDLVVVGTHARAGIRKLLSGSVAEEIFRHSSVPVLTVGPEAKGNGEDLKCVLFATDFTADSLAGMEYAVSMAQENQAHLVLLHVIRQFRKREVLGELSAADSIYHLNQIVPGDARLPFRPELMVKFGDPAEQIVEAAKRCGADMIVLGVRRADRLGMATHVKRTIAHDVVANAPCPVLTVRD